LRDRAATPAAAVGGQINRSLTMVRDEEGVIIRQIRTFQMDQSLENRIRERAYEIWTAHGCVHGQADQHWLAAEREILAASTPALAREPGPKKRRRSSVRSKAARMLALAG
jgi:hypothetical protein